MELTSQRILDGLPPLYRGFIPEFFQNSIPRETAATCANCAMWNVPGAEQRDAISFSRRAKCCAFYPNLPNYLVGAVLMSTDPSLEGGRSRLRARIEHRVGLAPHGIHCPPKRSLLYEHAPGAFGRNETLRCPYYEEQEGRCTISPFWNAICKTWFCKHAAGYDGHIFWMTLKKYLAVLEETLADYALYKMGWQSQTIDVLPSAGTLSPEELDELPTPDRVYRRLWGEWVGREEDLYEETYRMVAALTPDEFARIAGVRQTVVLQELERAYLAMTDPKPPAVLKRNARLVVEKMSDGAYLLAGYSPFDPLRVSGKLYEILHFFDDRQPNDAVLRALRRQGLPEPDDDLLLLLYQNRILVPAGNPVAETG